MKCVYCGKPVDEWYGDEPCPASPSGWHSALAPTPEPAVEVRATAVRAVVAVADAKVGDCVTHEELLAFVTGCRREGSNSSFYVVGGESYCDLPWATFKSLGPAAPTTYERIE